jgi:hypothetical protein
MPAMFCACWDAAACVRRVLYVGSLGCLCCLLLLLLLVLVWVPDVGPSYWECRACRAAARQSGRAAETMDAEATTTASEAVGGRTCRGRVDGNVQLGESRRATSRQGAGFGGAARLGGWSCESRGRIRSSRGRKRKRAVRSHIPRTRLRTRQHPRLAQRHVAHLAHLAQPAACCTAMREGLVPADSTANSALSHMVRRYLLSHRYYILHARSMPVLITARPA